MQSFTHDIVIVGGGIVGCTLACLLARQTNLSIALLESQTYFYPWRDSVYHHRVSAIALSSRRILQAVNVWDEIRQQRVSPFTKIHVWDALTKAEISFDCKEIMESVLGYIIENNLIQTELEKKLKSFPQIEFVCPGVPVTLNNNDQYIEIVTEDRVFKTQVAIAADGAHSWLREQSGITLEAYDYEQTAIVTTVKTELFAQKTAQQVFLDTGPLAFLPLAKPHASSIVWSLPNTKAEQIMQLDEEAFKLALAEAFSYRYGVVQKVEKRYSFPLRKQHASNYVQPRLALVGDSAHVIHPLAGQGLNMGLLDAACLCDVIVTAVNKGRNFASLANLRRYERWRKADNFVMYMGVDLIKKMFASDKKSIKALRSLGLDITNNMQFIKNIFTHHAVGNKKELFS